VKSFSVLLVIQTALILLTIFVTNSYPIYTSTPSQSGHMHYLKSVYT